MICQMLYHCSMGSIGLSVVPVLFTIYVISLASLLDSHGITYNFYPDDTQFYIKTEDVGDVKERVVALMSGLGK